MRLIGAVLTIAIVASAAAAANGGQTAPVDLLVAQPGYTIYNKPGATPADHDAALQKCVVPFRSYIREKTPIVIPVSTLAEVALVDFAGVVFGRLLTDASSVIDNCMVVEGWRVVRLPDAEGRKLDALGKPELLAAISPLVGAEQPPGEVVRVWNNDAAVGSSIRISSRVSLRGPVRLSVKVASLSSDQPKLPDLSFERPAPAVAQPWAGKRIAPADLAKIPEGASVLLIRVDGLKFMQEKGLILVRMGASPIGRASDGGLDRVLAMPPGFGNSTGMIAVLVPPGRWRLDKIDGTGKAFSLCLGAPSFEIKAGEVVFAGVYNFNADTIGPSLDLDVVRSWMGSAVQAPNLKAASYVNGTTFPCTSTTIEGRLDGLYALEVPGAPYEPGYTWGGAAVVAAQQAGSKSPN